MCNTYHQQYQSQINSIANIFEFDTVDGVVTNWCGCSLYEGSENRMTSTSKMNDATNPDCVDEFLKSKIFAHKSCLCKAKKRYGEESMLIDLDKQRHEILYIDALADSSHA